MFQFARLVPAAQGPPQLAPPLARRPVAKGSLVVSQRVLPVLEPNHVALTGDHGDDGRLAAAQADREARRLAAGRLRGFRSSSTI